MRCAFSLIALFISCLLHAQFSIDGAVVDAESGKPIRDASVFLDRTQTGAVSDINGRFKLNVRQGQYDIVVTTSGYKPVMKHIIVDQAIKEITFKLNARHKVLEEVVVRDDCKKVRWKKYGQLFTDNFIGNIPNARYCKIRNTGDILLIYCESSATMLAYADKPIKISNRALGYDLEFTLDRFELDTKKQLCYFKGMALFKERKGVGNDERLRRADAFQGSVQQFFRVLFKDSLTSNGFTVFKKKEKISKEEQKRIDLDPARNAFPDTKEQYLVEEATFDTSAYIGLEKIMVNQNALFKELYWDKELLVKYKTPTPKEEMYVNTLLAPLPTVRNYRSRIAPVQGSVFIDANGSHSGLPRLSGDFGKREVIANMLPIDYQSD